MERKRLLPYLIIGLILFYLGHWLVKLYQIAPETADSLNLFYKYEWAINNLENKPWLDLQVNQTSLLGGLVGFVIPLFLYLRIGDSGVYRHGEEKGSARFATVKEIATFRDKEPDNNMILSKNAQMGLFNKRLPYTKQVNKNGLGVGTPGDGKTLAIVKPNIMQMNSSYVTTDPKGNLVHELGTLLSENGYKIKIFDLVNLTNSNTFNVFQYMKSELDIDRVTEAIVEGTKKSEHRGEDFWVQAELLLTRSLIGYLYFDSQLSHYTPNLSMVSDMLRNIKRTDEETPSPVEKMFEELEERLPNNYATKQWSLFNNNFEEQTRSSVLAITATRYSVFDHESVTNLIATDSMEIDRWNLEKTAVFIAIPETNKAFNFLASMMFAMIFDILTHSADAILKGQRPGVQPEELLHVQFYLDEFANIGKIPNFNEVLSSVRSREISIFPIVQATSQLEEIYGRNGSRSIINNCGILIFLGTNDSDTMKFLSERTGEQTINQKNYTESRGRQRSSSISESANQRRLMTPDEIGRIGIGKTLVFISKQFVLLDDRYDISLHKNSKLLSEGPQDDNWYTYKRYMNDIEEWFENVDQTEVVDITDQVLSA